MAKKDEGNSGKRGGKNEKKDEPRRDEKKEIFERELRVILTPEQVAERADRAAHLLQQRDDKESLAKAAQKHAKSEIDELEATMRRLGGEVRDKATYLPTRCERVFDYRTGTVTETRLDTGEVISERPMTAEERQMAFDERKDDDGKGGGDLDADFEEAE